jgi:hypothetical protein
MRVARMTFVLDMDPPCHSLFAFDVHGQRLSFISPALRNDARWVQPAKVPCTQRPQTVCTVDCQCH